MEPTNNLASPENAEANKRKIKIIGLEEIPGAGSQPKKRPSKKQKVEKGQTQGQGTSSIPTDKVSMDQTKIIELEKNKKKDGIMDKKSDSIPTDKFENQKNVQTKVQNSYAMDKKMLEELELRIESMQEFVTDNVCRSLYTEKMRKLQLQKQEILDRHRSSFPGSTPTDKLKIQEKLEKQRNYNLKKKLSSSNPTDKQLRMEDQQKEKALERQRAKDKQERDSNMLRIKNLAGKDELLAPWNDINKDLASGGSGFGRAVDTLLHEKIESTIPIPVDAPAPKKVDLPRKLPETSTRRKPKSKIEDPCAHLDQKLLNELSESLPDLPAETIAQLLACVFADKFKHIFCVGEWRTPEFIVEGGLVEKAMKAYKAMMERDRVAKRRATIGAAALRAPAEKVAGKSTETTKELVLQTWNTNCVNQFTELDAALIKHVEEAVSASIVADVSITGCLDRLEEASKTRDKLLLADTAEKVVRAAGIAEHQETVKMYLGGAVALSKRSQKSDAVVLSSLGVSKDQCSLDNMWSNLECLIDRFGRNILFVLPFMDGFSLPELGVADAAELRELLTDAKFNFIKELLDSNFLLLGDQLSGLLEHMNIADDAEEAQCKKEKRKKKKK
jgi:hypothetical protein